MATAIITDVKSQSLSSIKNTDYFLSIPYEKLPKVAISESLPDLVSVTTKRSFGVDVIDKQNAVSITSLLPFRVRFVNIGINAYGPDNPAPIGIAIIGYSNYVL